jgi:Domain of unknown function (DUF3303)
MLFMVIERFKGGKAREVYRRYQEKGRMLPAGLQYVNSWVEPDFGRCFQLMECDDEALFHLWMAEWRDLVDFEIIPVVSSAKAAEIMARMP